MEQRKLGQTQFRFGDFGPGYILRGPRTDVGVVALRPGDDAANHYHLAIEETFIVVEGEATLWLNGRESFLIAVGDVCRLDPGEQHYFVNDSGAQFRALFIKAPYDPNDSVQVPWVPGEPIPAFAS